MLDNNSIETKPKNYQEETVIWRGSVSDLVTDLLNPIQLWELSSRLKDIIK